MGRYHSELMKVLFPNHKAIGIDLGNVEIKECKNNSHKFTLKADDKYAQFFLFYDWMLDMYFICNKVELPTIRVKRAISTNQVQKWAYFQTNDVDELLNEIKTILKDQNFLPEAYRVPGTQEKISISQEVVN